MEDKAKKIYEMYTSAMLFQGIECDDWEDLDQSDRNAWDDVAQRILSEGL